MRGIVLVFIIVLASGLFILLTPKHIDIIDYDYERITREMPDILYEKVVQSYKEGKLKEFNNKRFWISFGETESWMIDADGDTTSHWETKDIDISIKVTNTKGQKILYAYTYQEYK